jgi:hypothetical protein
MATVKWGAAPSSKGNVLTSQMDALGNGSYSVAGSAYDNSASSNLDRWGWLEFVTGGAIVPTVGATILAYMAQAPDGTNYGAGPLSNGPATHTLVGVMSLTTSTGSAQRAVMSSPFALPPSKVKFYLKNQAGVALFSTGNVLNLYTANESVA